MVWFKLHNQEKDQWNLSGVASGFRDTKMINHLVSDAHQLQTSKEHSCNHWNWSGWSWGRHFPEINRQHPKIGEKWKFSLFRRKLYIYSMSTSFGKMFTGDYKYVKTRGQCMSLTEKLNFRFLFSLYIFGFANKHQGSSIIQHAKNCRNCKQRRRWVLWNLCKSASEFA